MRILHIITGLNKGGAETLLCNLCQFDKEHAHTIISLSNVKDSQSLSSMHNFSLYSLNFPTGKVRVLGLLKLYKLIKKINPDVIQTWLIHADLIGGIAARFAGIKNIFWGVHHTILLPGKVKFSTIFILKCNAFLSNFVPKNIIYCAEKSRIIQESIGFKKILEMS
jgi:UDP-N-acetylglucosamine:LPS N-acetylglucosamine transferase